MKTKKLPAILALACAVALAGCGGSDPEVRDDEVLLHTGQLDVRFARNGQHFAQTYVLFGGGAIDHSISSVTHFGLPDYAARYIQNQYPDFYLCKSEGASMAQNETRQMDMVPANTKVEHQLKKALAMHRKSIEKGGQQVCVSIEGEMLTLRSVVLTELDQDITRELPRETPSEYFFVTSARFVDYQEAIVGQ